jgi:hypothetical protein
VHGAAPGVCGERAGRGSSEHLQPLRNIDDTIERDASQLFAIYELYGEEAEVVPEERLAKYAAATNRALQRQPRVSIPDMPDSVGKLCDLVELQL